MPCLLALRQALAGLTLSFDRLAEFDRAWSERFRIFCQRLQALGLFFNGQARFFGGRLFSRPAR